MRYLFLTLALLSGAVSAEEYYWQMPGKADRYDSASAGCEALRASARQPAEIVSFVKRENVEIYDCRIRRPASSGVGTIATTYQLNRYGDNCPSGTIYDPSIIDGSNQCVAPGGEKCGDEIIGGATIPKITNAQGQCVPFYDADKPSQCMHFAQSTRFTTIYVSVDDAGNAIKPPSIIEQGCVATVLDISHCKAPAPRKTGTVSLGPAPIRCRVALNFSGAPGDGDAPPWTAPPGQPGDICEPGADCIPPDEPIINDKQPCVYVPDGEGRMVCSSSQYTGKPGNYSNCGSSSTVNGGKFTCLGKNPSSTGTMTHTKVDTKLNGDGSTTTTKTDTQTKVVCSGVGSCTNQVTTNVTTTTKDPNGNITSDVSKCTGPNCKPSGGIDDGGSSGSGDGKGDGEGDKEEEEGPPGPSRNLQQGEQGSFAEGLSEWDERIAEARAELDQKLDEYGALFKGVFDLNLGAGGGSLPCETFSISTGGVSLRICPADYSEQLSYLRYVLLLAAAALAAVIVLRG
jgi:hypothetical protein